MLTTKPNLPSVLPAWHSFRPLPPELLQPKLDLPWLPSATARYSATVIFTTAKDRGFAIGPVGNE